MNTDKQATPATNAAMRPSKCPFLSKDEEGNLVIEWWNGDRKLTVYISKSADPLCIRVWGANIEEEMSESALLTDADMQREWEWLFPREHDAAQPAQAGEAVANVDIANKVVDELAKFRAIDANLRRDIRMIFKSLRPLYLHPQPEQPASAVDDSDVPRITEDALIGHAILPVGTPCAFVVSMAQAACKAYLKQHAQSPAVSPPSVVSVSDMLIDRMQSRIKEMGIYGNDREDRYLAEQMAVIALANATTAASAEQDAREGFYIATFKHNRRGYVLWWGPNNAGYTTDLKMAGIYAEPKPGYHDSDTCVPVPVAFARAFRARRMIDIGDTGNDVFWNAATLRAAIAAQQRQGGES